MDNSLFNARKAASTSVNCMYCDHSACAILITLISAQQIGSLAGISPTGALWFDRPLHAQSLGPDHHPHAIQIGDLRMPRLDPFPALTTDLSGSASSCSSGSALGSKGPHDRGASQSAKIVLEIRSDGSPLNPVSRGYSTVDKDVLDGLQTFHADRLSGLS
jgi:hypothetical protein